MALNETQQHASSLQILNDARQQELERLAYEKGALQLEVGRLRLEVGHMDTGCDEVRFFLPCFLRQQLIPHPRSWRSIPNSPNFKESSQACCMNPSVPR